jgi:hypothetical protein
MFLSLRISCAQRLPLRIVPRLIQYRFYSENVSKEPIISPPSTNEKMPSYARFLGVAGLIPFVATTAGSVYMPEAMFLMAEVQASYGSLILSFLGGIHWGLAMKTQNSNPRYLLSVLPSLLGFFAVDFVPHPPIRLLIESAGFVGLLGADWIAHKQHITPPWYLGLRLFLTGVVCTSMGLNCYLIYKAN